MNSYNPDENQGALEKLGIPVQTTPPEEVLTAGKAKSVRFRVSRPHGYSYGDVESYQFDHVIPTLEWYAETLHQRDLAVHKLGELVDKLEVDLLNTKAQLDNKDYNDALGLGLVEDEEMVKLVERVKALEEELNNTYAALEQARNAPVGSPDGEETYTREEVEGFLASAVEDAEKARDAHFQSVLQQKEQEFAVRLQQANAEAAQGNGEMYSEEEVETAVQEAVTRAVQETSQAKDEEYAPIINSHKAALEEAEQRLQQIANTPSYSEEEVEAAVAHAVAEKEAEMRARVPEQSGLDADLDDEEVLILRAENKRLKEDWQKMDDYTRQLDEYIAQLQGQPAQNPLSKIRPEDL